MRRMFHLLPILAFEASVVLYPGTALAFSGSIEAIGMTAVNGAVKYAGESRFISSIAKTAAISRAAGQSMAIEIGMARAATAGRAIAGACFANILVCAGAVGIAAWYAQSRIVDIGGEWKKGYDEYGTAFRSSIGGKMYYSATRDGLLPSGVGWCQGMGYYNCQASVYPGHEAKWYAPTGTASFVVKYTISASGTTYYSSVFDTAPYTGMIPKFRNATETDHMDHADAVPATDDAANDAKDRGVPIPVENPTIGPTGDGQFVPQGEKYPCTNFPSGQCQDGIVVKTDPANPPIGTVNTPSTKDGTDTGTDPGDEIPEKEDQCKIYPDSVGCTKFGEDPGDDVPKKTVTVSYAAEWLGLPAGCPAPIIVKGNSISYASACDAMNQIRPFVIALAAVGAMLTALAIIRSASA